MTRRLYHFEACPFCEKVRLALVLEGLPYDSVLVNPDDREETRKVSGQEEVPVLVDGTEVLSDSTTILRYLAGRPGSKLLPEARRDQALTWVLVDRSDAVLAPITSRLHRGKEPGGRPLPDHDVQVLERKLETELAVLEGILERGPFLFGERPTVADVSEHAFINRLQRGTGWKVPDPLVRVGAWFDRVAKAAEAK